MNLLKLRSIPLSSTHMVRIKGVGQWHHSVLENVNFPVANFASL